MSIAPYNDVEVKKRQILGILEAVWVHNRATTVMENLEYLTKLGLAEIREATQLYPAHPDRTMVARIRQWLYENGYMVGLGKGSPELIHIQHKDRLQLHLLQATDIKSILECEIKVK